MQEVTEEALALFQRVTGEALLEAGGYALEASPGSRAAAFGSAADAVRCDPCTAGPANRVAWETRWACGGLGSHIPNSRECARVPCQRMRTQRVCAGLCLARANTLRGCGARAARDRRWATACEAALRCAPWSEALLGHELCEEVVASVAEDEDEEPGPGLDEGGPGPLGEAAEEDDPDDLLGLHLPVLGPPVG